MWERPETEKIQPSDPVSCTVQRDKDGGFENDLHPPKYLVLEVGLERHHHYPEF